jgi:hypothetical protein
MLVLLPAVIQIIYVNQEYSYIFVVVVSPCLPCCMLLQKGKVWHEFFVGNNQTFRALNIYESENSLFRNCACF